MQPTVAAIADLEPAIRQLSDIDLAAKTIEFKERIAQGATIDEPPHRSLRRGPRGPAAASSTCAISTCS